MVGNFSDKLDLGKGVLATSGVSDMNIFIARLSP